MQNHAKNSEFTNRHCQAIQKETDRQLAVRHKSIRLAKS